MSVQITGERLGAMDDNDMSVYCTPGSSSVYWASNPSFMFDTCVATPQDFYDAHGIDREDVNKDGEYDDEIFDLDVELIEAR